VNKSDINSFEEYLESYLKILRKMSREEELKKSKDEQITGHPPNSGEENKITKNLKEDVNSKNNIKHDHQSEEKRETKIINNNNKGNSSSLKETNGEKGKNSHISVASITGTGNSTSTTNSTSTSNSSKSNIHTETNRTETKLPYNLTESNDIKIIHNLSTLNKNKTNSDNIMNIIEKKGRRITHLNTNRSAKSNKNHSETAHRTYTYSKDLLSLNNTIKSMNANSKSENSKDLKLHYNDDDDDVNVNFQGESNYKSSYNSQEKLFESNLTKSIDSFMLSTKSVVNSTRHDPEFEIYSNEEVQTSQNVNNTADNSNIDKTSNMLPESQDRKQSKNTSHDVEEIKYTGINDEEKIDDTQLRTQARPKKKIINSVESNNSSQNNTMSTEQKKDVIPKRVIKNDYRETKENSGNKTNQSNEEISDSDKENKDNKKSKQPSKGKTNIYNKKNPNELINESIENKLHKLKAIKKSHKNTHSHPNSHAYRKLYEEEEPIIPINKAPERNQPRNIILADVDKTSSEISNTHPENSQERNSAYEKLRKRKEEFEEIEKSNQKPEKKPKHSDTDNVEYKLYKRVIEISVSLIVIGLFMGILLGIIIVTYFNSKK